MENENKYSKITSCHLVYFKQHTNFSKEQSVIFGHTSWLEFDIESSHKNKSFYFKFKTQTYWGNRAVIIQLNVWPLPWSQEFTQDQRVGMHKWFAFQCNRVASCSLSPCDRLLILNYPVCSEPVGSKGVNPDQKSPKIAHVLWSQVWHTQGYLWWILTFLQLILSEILLLVLFFSVSLSWLTLVLFWPWYYSRARGSFQKFELLSSTFKINGKNIMDVFTPGGSPAFLENPPSTKAGPIDSGEERGSYCLLMTLLRKTQGWWDQT